MAGGWGDWGTAEAEVRLEAKVAMVSEQEISASRAPTHLGAQLGDGPHSPVGWWAARSTARLYGARVAKSSRTRSPGAGPRGQQPPRHQAATRQDRASRRQGARTAQVPTLRDSDGPCTRRQPPAYPSPGPLDAIKPGRLQGQRRSHPAADKRVQAPAPRQRGSPAATPSGSQMKGYSVRRLTECPRSPRNSGQRWHEGVPPRLTPRGRHPDHPGSRHPGETGRLAQA